MTTTAGATRGRPGLVANSRWNLVAFGCTLAANFVVVPFVVRWIGLPEFGRAGLVIAVCAPLTLVGTVIGQALVRELGDRHANDDPAGAAFALRAGLRLALANSFAVAIGLFLAGPPLTHLLVGASAGDGLHVAFAIAAAGWLFQQLALVLQGAAAGREDYRTIACVATFGAVATVTATLGWTAWQPDLDGYLAGIGTSFGMTLVAWAWALRHELAAALRASEPTAGASDSRRELLRFGRWQGLAQLAGTLGNQVDRYALGALAPVAIVGQYNVANRLQEAAYVGVVKASEVLFPRFSGLARRSVGERAEFFVRASWLAITFGAMLLAPLVPLSHAVLTLWVGAAAADGTDLLLRTLVLGGLVGCGSNIFTYYAMGIGRNEPVAWLSIVYSVLTVVLTVALIAAFGPATAGGGLLIASVVRVLLALFITRREFFPELRWSELGVSTLLPLVVGTALALGAQALDLGRASTWLGIVLLYPTFAAAVLACTVLATLAARSGRRILKVTTASWIRSLA
jgi:O-antigen/teichoic acid export membrane protein